MKLKPKALSKEIGGKLPILNNCIMISPAFGTNEGFQAEGQLHVRLALQSGMGFRRRRADEDNPGIT